MVILSNVDSVFDLKYFFVSSFMYFIAWNMHVWCCTRSFFAISLYCFFPSVISALNGRSFVAVFMNSSIVLLESDFLFHSFFMICSAIGWSLE